jgi:hypothetical protein
LTYSGHVKLAGVGRALALGGGALGVHLATSGLLHHFMDKKEKRRDKSGKIITVHHANGRADDIAGIITPFGVAGLAEYMAHRSKQRQK